MPDPVWVGHAPPALLDQIRSRRYGPWRSFDTRGAALHEWHPPPPTRPTQRSAISITNGRGVDLPFVRAIWAYYQQAAPHLGIELAPILEPEAVSRIRTGCRLDTHRDYQAAALSMSIMLDHPDTYNGGIFHITTPTGVRHEHKPPQGTVLVFPSQHRHGVTRITHGTRHTYVSKALTEPHPEVDTVNPHTGAISTAQPPDPTEIARRIKIQQTHNRLASNAWANNDTAAQHAANTWLWTHR